MRDRELAQADDGAWRISLAEVDRDGPFPVLAGHDRLLTVVEGRVLDLTVDGEAHVVEPQRPFAVTGDATVEAAVPEGPVQALVVVVDPALVRPYVTVLELGRSATLPVAADQAAYVVSGDRGGLASGTLVRGPGEVVGRCTVAVVTLERVS
ncbi:MAG TPA: HutD family protein [Nocardioides sp.]|nr:HutD family protein [Nocardioides sp.]